MIESPSGPILQAVDLKHIRDLAMKVRRVLMEKPSSKMTFDDFCNAFKAYYGEEKCELETLEKELSDVVKVDMHLILSLSNGVLMMDLVCIKNYMSYFKTTTAPNCVQLFVALTRIFSENLVQVRLLILS